MANQPGPSGVAVVRALDPARLAAAAAGLLALGLLVGALLLPHPAPSHGAGRSQGAAQLCAALNAPEAPCLAEAPALLESLDATIRGLPFMAGAVALAGPHRGAS